MLYEVITDIPFGHRLVIGHAPRQAQEVLVRKGGLGAATDLTGQDETLTP